MKSVWSEQIQSVCQGSLLLIPSGKLQLGSTSGRSLSSDVSLKKDHEVALGHRYSDNSEVTMFSINLSDHESDKLPT